MFDRVYPQYLANGLLFGAAAFFCAAHIYHPFGTANSVILATSEAALIGGVADWFAVTALFRRPLGLPVPHTAVIPNSKQRIGEALATFLGENFVNEEKLATFITEQVFPRLISSFETASARRELADRLAPFIVELAGVLKSQYQPVVQDVLRPTLAEIRISRVIGGILAAALKVRSTALVSRVLFIVHSLLKSHEAAVMKLISSELPWYIPGFIGERIYRDILRSLLQRIESGAGVTDTVTYLERLSVELSVTSELSDTLDNLWRETLTNPEASALQSLWTELFSFDSGSSSIESLARNVEVFLEILGRGLKRGGESATFSNMLHRATGLIVRHFSRDILRWISDTIANWDSATISGKIEEKIGTDLQYIRVNGTLVGALVGFLLHTLIN